MRDSASRSLQGLGSSSAATGAIWIAPLELRIDKAPKPFREWTCA